MAGRLPGVGLPARKRVHLLQHEVHRDKYSREVYQKKCLELAGSSPLTPATTMDETALKARQRLEQKLGYIDASSSSENDVCHFWPLTISIRGHHHSCRLCCQSFKTSHDVKEGRDEKLSVTQRSKRYGRFGIIQLGRSWLLQLGRQKKRRKDICAVCLEDFECEEEQPIMELPCSHKYHRACLIPWLAAHPHCPYCRSPVQLAS